MSAPLPGTEDIESFDQLDIALRIIDESVARCAPIDKRLIQLTHEFLNLSKEYERIKSYAPRAQLIKLVEKMDINRDIRTTLYRLRWKNI